MLVLAAAALTGCGKGGAEPSTATSTSRKLAPVAAQGAVSVATRNTTRLGGEDVAADAAAVARAVYPGLTAATRPLAVVLVNEHERLPALAASVLASAPTGAPILFSEGETLPAVTAETLEAMHPLGAPTLGGAQVIRIGTDAPVPHGYLTRTVRVGVGLPTVAAAAVEQLAVTLDGGSAPKQVIVIAADAAPAMTMPAASLAAESGAPILFVTSGRVPVQTAAVLAALHQPSIYVIDATALGHHTLAELRNFGTVKTITTDASAASAAEAVQNAIAVARFTDGSFGWGVKEPGHGLVFANLAARWTPPPRRCSRRPATTGRCCCSKAPIKLPPALTSYLSDIQPAYSNPQFPPVRGAYNHGWLIGDEASDLRGHPG